MMRPSAQVTENAVTKAANLRLVTAVSYFSWHRTASAQELPQRESLELLILSCPKLSKHGSVTTPINKPFPSSRPTLDDPNCPFPRLSCSNGLSSKGKLLMHPSYRCLNLLKPAPLTMQYCPQINTGLAHNRLEMTQPCNMHSRGSAKYPSRAQDIAGTFMTGRFKVKSWPQHCSCHGHQGGL